MQAPAMAQLRDVIDELLQGYKPYPALVLDAGYNVVTYPVLAKESNDATGAERAFALPLRIQHGKAVLSFITTVATFNTPLDTTVSELAIETDWPPTLRQPSSGRPSRTARNSGTSCR